MIEISTRLEPDSGDCWVLASYRTDRGEVAVYMVRVPYLDRIRPDSAKVFEEAGALARHHLERMLDAHRRN